VIQGLHTLGSLIVNDDACYFLACIWYCYGGGLEVDDDAGEYKAVVGECEGGTFAVM